ncbi:peptidylprolyl isomerase [Heliorestis convoluta]|uniref:Peptidyl-prolyl cis-trans isomerase n=1 Tax=Heliorestis convoluta TaxID=356322 RepID=A0A5Q2N5B3_9FIRM|nr:peptidylprolyl isomerase [Heliorestis convoluta]QGG48816.1 peptidylprolyl isomerase [Heliorestis convoluta]
MLSFSQAKKVMILSLCSVFLLAGCGSNGQSNVDDASQSSVQTSPPAVSMKQNQYPQAPDTIINPDNQYIVTMETTYGTMKIELLPEAAPLAVNSFVFLAQEGFFDGIRFHRVVEDFMIQAGDPVGLGFGGPGYTFADELPPALPYGPGVVAMANAGPNTNGSQFFIVTGNETSPSVQYLNQQAPNYTVFGRVIEGFDVALQISKAPVTMSNGGERSFPVEEIVMERVQIEEK